MKCIKCSHETFAEGKGSEKCPNCGSFLNTGESKGKWYNAQANLGKQRGKLVLDRKDERKAAKSWKQK